MSEGQTNVGASLTRDLDSTGLSRDKPAPTGKSISSNFMLLLSFCLLTFLTSCSRYPTTGYLKGDTMGTFYTIQYRSNKALDPHELDTVLKNTLSEFNSQLSNWQDNSWISQFNAAPANRAVPIPEHAYNVVRLSLELAERTNGAFDPTLSPVIELWGFGTGRSERVPEERSIQAALGKVGYQKLVLDSENRALLKTDPHLQLNCSAVAKGYAVDLVARELRKRGVQGMLINIGGEVYAAGTKGNGSPWTVGIQKNLPSGRLSKPKRSISLNDQALATSGHSQRFFFVNGHRYSHILNGKTGRPVAAPVASATVIAPNCALADGLATIALIIDSGAMKQLVSQYNGIEYFYTPWDTQDQLTDSEDRLSSRRATEG
ncbi:MAG TPA: hypothetical protein DIV79_00585 [Opitutae bacterium]|nr:hypothetical protein [Opitutaceae bacterium]HCR28497.1 hypothetical protein [Opitutae bacterium]